MKEKRFFDKWACKKSKNNNVKMHFQHFIKKKYFFPENSIFFYDFSIFEHSEIIEKIFIDLGPRFPIRRFKITGELWKQDCLFSRLLNEARNSIMLKIIETSKYYQGELVALKFNSSDKKLKNKEFVIINLICQTGGIWLKLKGLLLEKFKKLDPSIGQIFSIFPQKHVIKKIGNTGHKIIQKGNIFNEFTKLPKKKVYEISKNSYYLSLNQFFRLLKLKFPGRNLEKILDYYQKTGVVEIIKGILIIENSNNLDQFSASVLKKLTELKLLPLIFVAQKGYVFFRFPTHGNLSNFIFPRISKLCHNLNNKVFSHHSFFLNNISELKKIIVTGRCVFILKRMVSWKNNNYLEKIIWFLPIIQAIQKKEYINVKIMKFSAYFFSDGFNISQTLKYGEINSRILKSY